MSYKTYITEALVCGSRPSNTADKTYLLFTREAGMVYATAKSVREERSKQRFALQEFSYLRATLIYGKAGWRVTGTEPIVNVYAIQAHREGRGFVRNSVRLLRRLLHGESAHAALFDDVMRTLMVPKKESALAAEEVLTIRMLHALGYIAPETTVAPLLEAPSVEEALTTWSDTEALERKKIIEQAFRESHL